VIINLSGLILLLFSTIFPKLWADVSPQFIFRYIHALRAVLTALQLLGPSPKTPLPIENIHSDRDVI
jgi:hypothetical protein